MARYGAQFGPDITFLGVPACDLADPASYEGADVVVVGAPFDGGTSHRPGTRFGPQAIRMTDYLAHDGSRPSLALRTDGLTDLRVMAISRLMLDNFPHVKAYWVMLGIKTAQVALSYGADDIDGTVVHEKIYHEAGSDSPQELTVADLRRLIEEAGRTPVERDTLYNEVVRDRPTETRWQTGRKLSLV